MSATSGERLDKFLAGKAQEFSRSQWQRMIQSGAVLINGQGVTKPGFKLRVGDRIVILKENLETPKKEFVLEAEPDITLEIVYEDTDIVVVNKPAGLLVHPTLKQPQHTLVNALIARYPKLVGVGENPLRPGIVHRLDKDTSGLLVVAKNQSAFSFLKNQFLERAVTKKYLALVHGVPARKTGNIEYPIRPSKDNRLKKVAIKKDEILKKKSTRLAKTRYRVLKTAGDTFALLEVTPLTGRTHQIRVHLSSIGHPIVGDRLYGLKSQTYADKNADQRGRFLVQRQFLHAFYLKFIAPSGTPLALEAELPDELKKILISLGVPDREAGVNISN